MTKTYLLGYDVGSSSVKASLLNAETGTVIASAISPKKEMEIIAHQPGWAEQHPAMWWENVKAATAELGSVANVDLAHVAAIGISYQMHGLVLLDKNHHVLRPAIIWCDSRAVAIGDKAFAEIGQEKCLKHLLNSPGNFTASKLKWVMQNEPQLYHQIYKVMLPGDYVAFKLSGQIKTTASGLSEAILWDYQDQRVADMVLDYYGISPTLLPDIVPTFSIQGELTREAAKELGLKTGTKITYRAGDQPNNAMSLNVLQPGEIAATAGTSGVICGIADNPGYDRQSRVNSFVHVNHRPDQPRYTVLLCVNGAGILNSWLKHNLMGPDDDYDKMNELAAQTPIGAAGLSILPYGNGAERPLGNKNIGASVHGWNFNTHNRTHFLRAAQEGIVFALNYGLDIMRDIGLEIKTVHAGFANMFLSPLFASAFADTTGAKVELYNTDGAAGAARAAGIAAGIYNNTTEAFADLKSEKTIEPNPADQPAYTRAYQNWLKCLQASIAI